jgi:hypothetical protein
LRELIPSARDEGGISVYRVTGDDDNLATHIVAAFGVHSRNLDRGPGLVFVAADKDALEGDGFVLKESKGDLNHVEADASHLELAIATVPDLLKVAAHFLRGKFFFFEQKEVSNVVRAAVRNDEYEFAPIAKRGGEYMPAKNLLKFVGEEIAEVHGVKTKEAEEPQVSKV